MKELIKFLIEKITGSTEFEIEETTDEYGPVFMVKARKDIIGLIIGKGGNTIKNIRKIASIKAVIESTSVNISVTERV